MRVLLVAEMDWAFLPTYITEVLEPMNASLDIYPLKPMNEWTLQFCMQHHIGAPDVDQSYLGYFATPRTLWQKLRGLYVLCRACRKKQYDVIQIHYACYGINLLMALWAKGRKTKVVLSYWGSDILRENRALLLKWKWPLKRYVDCFTFASSKMRTVFLDCYGESMRLKTRVLLFGSSVMTEIRKLYDCVDIHAQSGAVQHVLRENCRSSFGIKEDAITVAVGYNAIPAQQHKAILEAISTLPMEIKNKLHLILHMMNCTYDDVYIAQVRQSVEKTGCSFLWLEKVLPFRDAAQLRMATDIFINAQTTDAICASFCEHLYCGNIVLNGQWLHYDEIDQYRLQLVEFERFDQLPALLTALTNGNLHVDTAWNREAVWRLRSWDTCAKAWREALTALAPAPETASRD